MTFGSMQLVAYKYDAFGNKLPAEFNAQIFGVQNEHHLTAAWKFTDYEVEPSGGNYAWGSFVVSESDDCQVVLQNLEAADDVTFYIFFFRNDGTPVGNGYGSTVHVMSQGICSVKTQTGL